MKGEDERKMEEAGNGRGGGGEMEGLLASMKE